MVNKRSQSAAKKAAGNHSKAAHQCEGGELSKDDVKCTTSILSLPTEFLCPVHTGRDHFQLSGELRCSEKVAEIARTGSRQDLASSEV